MSSLIQRRAVARLRRDHHRAGHGAETLAARIRRGLAEWRRRACSRAQLALLDERTLRDIGLTPAEAAREAAKPFWIG